MFLDKTTMYKTSQGKNSPFPGRKIQHLNHQNVPKIPACSSSYAAGVEITSRFVPVPIRM